MQINGKIVNDILGKRYGATCVFSNEIYFDHCQNPNAKAVGNDARAIRLTEMEALQQWEQLQLLLSSRIITCLHLLRNDMVVPSCGPAVANHLPLYFLAG